MKRLCRVACLALAACAGAAHAVTFVVTRTDDPAPDGCKVGDCSLREAVIAAGAAAGTLNEITLGAATYHLGATVQSLIGSLQITGAGSASSRIESNDHTLLQLNGDALYLTGLSLDAGGAAELAGEAGAILFNDVAAPNADGIISVFAATIGVRDCDMRAVFTAYDIAHADVADSTFVAVALFGGGNSNASFVDVNVSNITVDGSLAPTARSGLTIGVLGQTASTSIISVADVTIEHGTDGALFYALPDNSHFEISRLRYVDNANPVFVQDQASARIVDSEFSDNHHDDPAFPRAGALQVIAPLASVEVLRSTFENNRGTAPTGGAVRVALGGALAIRNSTFSGNTFNTTAAAGGVRGAAIGFDSSADLTSLVLQHVTIVAPAVTPAGVAGTAIGGNGGESGLALDVYNSIVRGSCALDADAMDFALGNVATATGCQFAAGTNQTGVSSSDLALGALADNGGWTRTFLPSPSSVALGAADASFCLDEDQRRYARPLGAGCDAGAIEAGDVVFADGFE